MGKPANSRQQRPKKLFAAAALSSFRDGLFMSRFFATVVPHFHPPHPFPRYFTTINTSRITKAQHRKRSDSDLLPWNVCPNGMKLNSSRSDSAISLPPLSWPALLLPYPPPVQCALVPFKGRCAKQPTRPTDRDRVSQDSPSFP